MTGQVGGEFYISLETTFPNPLRASEAVFGASGLDCISRKNEGATLCPLLQGQMKNYFSLGKSGFLLFGNVLPELCLFSVQKDDELLSWPSVRPGLSYSWSGRCRL